MLKAVIKRLFPTNKVLRARPEFGEDKRVIIIHNHVFKNAGTTIDWALRKNFGKAFVDHRDDRNMQRGAEFLGPYLKESSWIKALSTHHLRPPLPVMNDTLLLTIMMFRHPIERVTSVYNFERKQINADTLGARYARNHDLREYVLWRMRFDVPPTIRNFHIYRTLPPPADWKREVDKADLAKAISYVESIEMLGFVEHFDESMVLFEETLRPFFPEIDLSYEIQNVGQPREKTQAERIEGLRQELGNDVFNLLMENNMKDLDLYGSARKSFNERINRVPSFNAKLADFRRRCMQYL